MDIGVPERGPHGSARLFEGDALDAYAAWPAPTLIISDGAYGLGMFPGEPKGTAGLREWYAPHVEAWSRAALPRTTLWLWNREAGWAAVHPLLEEQGWEFRELTVWDKGVSHVAGNVNGKTIRGLPIVTEVAARYVRAVRLPSPSGGSLPLREWLRAEWERSGLPLRMANEACGVRDAATRKYLTLSDLWYFPPGRAVEAMAAFCEARGRPNGGTPYFSLDRATPPSAAAWEGMRARWNHEHGLTNVWPHPALRGSARTQEGAGRAAHANEKPLQLMRRMVRAATDPGDVVWEPFGGLCSGSLAAAEEGRSAWAAERHPEFARAARARLEEFLD